MHVRPSWKASLGEALPYSVRALLTAYRMARGGCPELYLEIPISPPSTNALYRKFHNTKTHKVGYALEKSVEAYREMTTAACWGKRFEPRGVIACVIAVEDPRWVTKEHKAGQRDVDNPIKSVIDALKLALHFEDHLLWEVHAAKLFGRREATHVWLFDIGDVVNAVGAQSVLANAR